MLNGAAHVLDLARISSARAFPFLYAARVGASSTDVRRKHLPSKAPQGCIAWTTTYYYCGVGVEHCTVQVEYAS